MYKKHGLFICSLTLIESHNEAELMRSILSVAVFLFLGLLVADREWLFFMCSVLEDWV